LGTGKKLGESDERIGLSKAADAKPLDIHTIMTSETIQNCFISVTSRSIPNPRNDRWKLLELIPGLCPVERRIGMAGDTTRLDGADC
jgi:hypothetical protein